MAILKCKMCGGDIELSADKTFGTCDHCGSTMTFPKVDDEQRASLFNRGNHFRRMGEFDKALAVYERIVQEDETDAEAHWCCALCRFGIEYVEDPNTYEYLPTCHRASFDSFLEDVDYLAAVDNSDGVTRRQYQRDAAKIAEVQRGILATSQNEEPFDVFICYKESEEDGTRTRDSLMAQEIYYQLTEQGRRVFFSRITLEDKAGTEYEPYIFAALNSAKVMIVVTTSPEHANSVWVKNEWSRFLSLMRKDRHKLLLPCYRDMDPYDLPEALSVLQSYDMGRIGFIQDLIRGVNKVLNAEKPKTPVKETAVTRQSSVAAPLLRRAFLFLEDGAWANADEYCEKVLDAEPENGEAYLGKLMAELHIKTRDALKDQPETFDNRNNYQKAMRFGDSGLRSLLSDSTAFIIKRNEETRRDGIYQNAQRLMQQSAYREAATLFGSIADYKDAGERENDCLEKAEVIRKESIYQSAMRLMNQSDYAKAADSFATILDYKDVQEKIAECREKEEEARKEAIFMTALQYMEKGDFDKAIDSFTSVSDYKDSREKISECKEKAETARKEAIYQTALQYMEQGNNQKAIETFQKVEDYRDSREKMTACTEKAEAERKNAIYSEAIQAARTKTIDSQQRAIELFESIYGWRDTKDRIAAAKKKISEIHMRKEREHRKTMQKEAHALEETNAIKKQKYRRILLVGVPAVLIAVLAIMFITVIRPNLQYNEAVKLYQSGQYNEAIAAFETLNGYKDSAEQIQICQKDKSYEKAVELYNSGQYEEAVTAFETLNGYKDSAEQIQICQNAIKDKSYEKAIELYNAGQYEQAITALEALNGYKDSTEKIKAVKLSYHKELLLKATVGSTVIFGSYEQDNDITDGKEDIEWIVLAKEDSRILVISKYVLDCQQYNTSWKSITWESCSLRRWLNNTLLHEAFSIEEQKLISRVNVEAKLNSSHNTNPGENITDQVFLLSIKEAEQFFHSDEERQCRATQYAISNNASTNADGYCWWWLRSSGSHADNASAVLADGSIFDVGFYVFDDFIAVRPALWIETGIKAATTDSVANVDKADETSNSYDDDEKDVQKSKVVIINASELQVGGTVLFGSYEQDNLIDNGKEDIEWIVLAKENNRILVISKHALDCQRYNSTEADVTWETCSLRSWLNNTFLNEAFSQEEKRLIPSVLVTADKNPEYDRSNQGRSTTDQVFLLSIKEANLYFGSNAARICEPTEYTIAKNAHIDNGKCWWWLRSLGKSTGFKNTFSAYVYIDGSVIDYGNSVNSDDLAIRPAMWIDIDKIKTIKTIESVDAETSARRVALRNTIAAGSSHTVAVKSDGTVYAVANNSVGGNYNGLINISNWKKIIAIAAGQNHTVGLKSDGTVVAVGGNEQGQCKVSKWRDIIAIAAGDGYTVGLQSDGTVVAVGKNEQGQCQVSDWTGIVAISAGHAHTVGLKSDGTVIATGDNTYGQCNISDWTDIMAISAGGDGLRTKYSHTVGLKTNGTVVAVGNNEYGQCNVSAWRDIIAIAAGDGYTVGLQSDGTVVAVGMQDFGRCDISGWKNIVAISAKTHTVGLRTDGTVVAVGFGYYDNDRQGLEACDISGWKDIMLPDIVNQTDMD